ncbi:outer membrane lipoprotein carrier protein LolA [Flavobacteriaceae bacterium F08102]|nr:outer membrane lipoprotein carrier protein LolA [Flavobacteriaceae bacterium F08102]
MKKTINKMNMRGLVLCICVMITSTVCVAQGEFKAKKLLDEVSEKIKAYENIYIEFKYKLENTEESVHQETRGNVTLKGDLYNVNFLGTNQIFDGKKTYTIITEDEEVNVSDASDDEEDTITPSKFFSFYENGFTYKWDKLENLNGRKIQFVYLRPIDSNSDIDYIRLGIDVKTKHIYKLIETGKNGTVTTLTVTAFKTNQRLSNSLFSFDETKYKDLGYIINEL